MKTINQIQDEIIEEFSDFDDWMDRYSIIIDLGNSLPAIDENTRCPTTLLRDVRAVCGSTPR